MTIHVHDSYTAIRDILDAPISERPALLEAMMHPVREMYRYVPDHLDLVTLHHWGSGFPLDREDNRHREELERLREADAWNRIETAVLDGLERQNAAAPHLAVPDDIHVMLVLGDPGDEHLVDVSRGYLGNGSVPGYIYLTMWPTQENLARLEGLTVHELNHNIRYSNVVWDPATVNVGEHVISEGLADAFARELYGEVGLTLMGLEAQGDDAVFEKVVSGLAVTGMQNFSAWVHGDATASRMGAEPVGLPTGAGYAAGLRLVEAYLDATGATAAECTAAPSAEVIRVALDAP